MPATFTQQPTRLCCTALTCHAHAAAHPRPACPSRLLAGPALSTAAHLSLTAALKLAAHCCYLPAPAEDAALDFTDGTPAEAATVAADFKQKSLIDVEEDISYEDEEEEEEEVSCPVDAFWHVGTLAQETKPPCDLFTQPGCRRATFPGGGTCLSLPVQQSFCWGSVLLDALLQRADGLPLVTPCLPASPAGGGDLRSPQEGRPAVLVCAEHWCQRGGHPGVQLLHKYTKYTRVLLCCCRT